MVKSALANDVDLWLFDIGSFDQDKLSILSEVELAESAGFTNKQVKNQFLATRICSREILADYCGVEPHQLHFEKSASGKPYIASSLNSHDVRFSLSHSAGKGALVVAHGRDVGVDIESIQRKADYLKLAQNYFSLQEYSHLKNLSTNELAPKFFEIWTLKEAFVKAVGKGLAFGLDKFWFDVNGDSVQVNFSPNIEQDFHFQFYLRHHNMFVIAAAIEVATATK